MWGKGIAQQPPTVTWKEVMSTEDEKGVARWLIKLSQFGFCFVTDMPATPEDTEALIRKIAFIRETHYGGFWDFTSDLSHGDTAYTNLALGAHTDTTYFTDPAGLQLFHLLSHTAAVKDGSAATGGESLLVDGFFAAKILREVHPEAYQTLSTVRISTHSAGDDDILVRPLKKAGYPILEHDEGTGQLIRIRYNNDDRSVLRVKDDQVVPFYDALNKWHEILTNSDSEYWSQLVPGTALSEWARCFLFQQLGRSS
jgi:trimethyllysine dioxygenase